LAGAPYSKALIRCASLIIEVFNNSRKAPRNPCKKSPKKRLRALKSFGDGGCLQKSKDNAVM
jgi:hypothetical protein